MTFFAGNFFVWPRNVFYPREITSLFLFLSLLRHFLFKTSSGTTPLFSSSSPGYPLTSGTVYSPPPRLLPRNTFSRSAFKLKKPSKYCSWKCAAVTAIAAAALLAILLSYFIGKWRRTECNTWWGLITSWLNQRLSFYEESHTHTHTASKMLEIWSLRELPPNEHMLCQLSISFVLFCKPSLFSTDTYMKISFLFIHPRPQTKHVKLTACSKHKADF